MLTSVSNQMQSRTLIAIYYLVDCCRSYVPEIFDHTLYVCICVYVCVCRITFFISLNTSSRELSLGYMTLSNKCVITMCVCLVFL